MTHPIFKQLDDLLIAVANGEASAVQIAEMKKSLKIITTQQLSDTEVEDVMKRTRYQSSCCNDYWPPNFAEAIQKRLQRSIITALGKKG